MKMIYKKIHKINKPIKTNKIYKTNQTLFKCIYLNKHINSKKAIKKSKIKQKNNQTDFLKKH